jgi:hypothetical protein
MSVNRDTMANKAMKELPFCLTCLEKWAHVDSQDKEASQVYLESLEVKV